MSIILTKNKAETSRIESGKFNIDDHAIAGGTVYTVEIALSRSDYNFGKIFFYVPISIYYSKNRRMNFEFEFTAILNDAIGKSSFRKNYVILGYSGLPYYFDNYWNKGYKYEEDGKLSDVYFVDNGQQTGTKGMSV